MNEVYITKGGKVYLNGQIIDGVSSVSVKTTWTGSQIVLEFDGSYKSDYQPNVKTHPLDECAKE